MKMAATDFYSRFNIGKLDLVTCGDAWTIPVNSPALLISVYFAFDCSSFFTPERADVILTVPTDIHCKQPIPYK